MQPDARKNWVSRLRRFLAQTPHEACDFCSAKIGFEHAHLIERATRKFFCACQGCAFSLGDSERFCLVEPRIDALDNFSLSDADWSGLRIPIDMAFVLQSSPHGGPLAVYPGPAGATESLLSPAVWARLSRANPVLAQMRPDVEALLVNRTKGRCEYFLVSIDHCYALIGLIRTHWRGLAGGSQAWDAIGEFFAKLRKTGRPWVEGPAHG